MAYRRTTVPTIALTLLLSFASGAMGAGPATPPVVPRILAAAESLFVSLKDHDYPAVWAVLTEKSRETIVSETDDALRKAGGAVMPKDQLREDFATGGPTCRRYWEGFLKRFDPNDALERSRWEMGTVEKDRAEVLITHRGADRPAVLRMFREGGSWKVGLVETFWEH